MTMATGSKKTFFFRISEFQTFYLSFTTIFLCTGFFYNFVFFRLFNIRAELFFTLQDYLASSIEKVYLIVVAILLASGGSHVIRYLLKEQKKLLGHRLFQGFLYLFPLLLFVAGLIVIMKLDNPTGYYLLSFSVYITCDYLLFKIIFKGNHESYSRFFILTVLLLYLLLIGSTIIIDRDAVYKEPLNELKRYRISFSDRVHLKQAPLVLLEANSSYYFFYDKQTRQSIVMRKEMIDYVENIH
ncbi:hypothetical protein [Geobacter sp. AOG2]|uniref:hypothetical protein n=1 Tax=Geobacter sp. AOG2 TaxID=1566347 RepID=UPI001CC4FF84|nr:hypothetical protein [Geobacter sp. AOG2]GFE60715.1 hypothetical protein AOG2_13030 [Geobacter sp. AOG2]